VGWVRFQFSLLYILVPVQQSARVRIQRNGNRPLGLAYTYAATASRQWHERNRRL